MSCCTNNYLNAAQIGNTYSRYNPNPCCMIDSYPGIFNTFSSGLSSQYKYAGPALKNKMLRAVRTFPQR